MAPKITAPDAAFTGTVSGIEFTAGVGEVDSIDDAARAVLTDHGYTIEASAKVVEIPEGTPSEEWTADQLKAYAAKHEIDLGSAKKKPEMVQAITDAEKAKEAAATGDPNGTPPAE
ncbi:hypothetical protein MN032_17815 [Agromyces atrinae]|uniref:hypothetical protein n=1 Tax=Agromyces atrinae TaxID=592376 RepID=UPI001F57B9A0|nr:hypothetical protein [Agromyces atrinae]MCI2959546.1 hypothetical protein [Agromyces atrinae]